MTQTTRILAIETSCDETAAAVIENGATILSNIIASQVDLHAQYGGVFPGSGLTAAHRSDSSGGDAGDERSPPGL
jgi:tRNA A37 threonylcarbamoyltransferase TsaD